MKGEKKTEEGGAKAGHGMRDWGREGVKEEVSN